MKRNREIPSKTGKIFLLFFLFIAQVQLKSSHKNGETDAEYPKGCSFLRCEKNDQCVIRTFWCKNPPCPSMLYCSKNSKESLRGPATCDFVRCSKGYVCHVKVRHCRWEKCEQQIARCISEREYYEGPASCAGFKCPSGRRCILRESFCIRPPCKLLKSCAKYNDARLWLDRCRNLGCPSEHECFLRRPDEKCSHPPCKHTPDCTATKVDELPLNEHCRGWICPKTQECSAQVQGPCDHRGNCKVKRYCYDSLAEMANSSSSKNEEIPGERQMFTTADKADNHTPITKTLAQMEKELIMKDQESLKKEISRFSTTTKSTVETTGKMLIKAGDEKENEVDSYRPSDDKNAYHGIPIVKPPIFTTTTRKPTVLVDTYSVSPLDKIIATFPSQSSWLEELKLKTSVDAIRFWMENAKDEKNYPQFQGWLESVKEILGPTIYELWLEDVRGLTIQNPAIQKWLPPPSSMRRILDLQRPLDPGKGTSSLTKFPPTIEENNRQYSPDILKGGRKSVHDKWNIRQGMNSFNFSSDRNPGIDSQFPREDMFNKPGFGSKNQNLDVYYSRPNYENDYDQMRWQNFPEENSAVRSRYENDPRLKDINIYTPSPYEEEPRRRLGSLEKSIASAEGYWLPQEPYHSTIPQNPEQAFLPFAPNFNDFETPSHPIKNFQPNGNDVTTMEKQMLGHEMGPFLSWSGGSPAAIESAGLLSKNTKADIGVTGGESIKLFRPSFNEVVQDYEYDPWRQGFFRANTNSSRSSPSDERQPSVSPEDPPQNAFANKIPAGSFLEPGPSEGLMRAFPYDNSQWSENFPRPPYDAQRNHPLFPALFRDAKSLNFRSQWPRGGRIGRDWQKRLSEEDVRLNGDDWTGMKNLFTPHRKLPISLYGVLRSGPIEDPRSTGYPLFYPHTPEVPVDEEFRLLAPYAAYYQQYMPRADDYFEYYERFHTDTDNAGPVVRNDNLEDGLRRNYRPFLNDVLQRGRHLEFSMIDKPGKPMNQLPADLLESWQLHHRNFLATLHRILDKEKLYHYGGNLEYPLTQENWRGRFENIEPVLRDNGKHRAEFGVVRSENTAVEKSSTAREDLAGQTGVEHVNGREDPARIYEDSGKSNERTTKSSTDEENTINPTQGSLVYGHVENAEIPNKETYERSRERFAKFGDFARQTNSQDKEGFFNKTQMTNFFRPAEFYEKYRGTVNVPSWERSAFRDGQTFPVGSVMAREFGEPRQNLRNVQMVPDVMALKTPDPGPITAEVTSGPWLNPEYVLTTPKIIEKAHIAVETAGQEEDSFYSDDKDYEDEENEKDGDERVDINRRLNETIRKGSGKNSAVRISDYDVTYN